MKKVFRFLSCLVLIVSMVSCGKGLDDYNDDYDGTNRPYKSKRQTEKLVPIKEYETANGWSVTFYDINGFIWVEYLTFDTKIFYPLNGDCGFKTNTGLEDLAVGDTDEGI